jgi:TnpA family transposase
VPVDFLTEEQKSSYGRYAGEPSAADLTKFFHLDDADHQLIKMRRGKHNRLGYAVQLATVRYLGTFLSNPLETPPGVTAYVAAQLGVEPGCLPEYLERRPTRMEHAAEIKARFGYRDFEEQPGHWRLMRWLYERAWLTAERPSVLFDLATARLVSNRVLLPGVSTLERLIASICDRAANRLWGLLYAIPSKSEKRKLDSLLSVEEGQRKSRLERLRNAPVTISTTALVAALERLKEIRALGAGSYDLSGLPSGRIKLLFRFASSSKATVLERMPEERRIATLFAFAHSLEESALDDAIDVLDQLTAALVRKSAHNGKAKRLRTLKDLDSAALRLCTACELILDPELNDVDLRREVFSIMSNVELQEAISTVFSLARRPDHNYREELMEKWLTVRRFLPTLLRTIDFQCTETARPVRKALQFLKAIEGNRHPDMSKAPTEILSRGWRQIVYNENGVPDRCAYTFCVLERLRDTLRSRDIFLEHSSRWADPRSKLLQPEKWQTSRVQLCRSLNRKTVPAEEVTALAEALHSAYLNVSANLPSNQNVRIEKQEDKDALVVTPLEVLEEPQSLVCLRGTVSGMLPVVDLADILLEIGSRTGFAQEFRHLSETDSRIDDLDVSICAVLIAEACNIGLEPVINSRVPALSRDRLSFVKQNYFRIDTISKANARLVEAQSKIRLARQWGGGEVASADGLRFVVPVKTVNAGPNPKYFGIGRGVTYYNFSSDQFSGFHGIVIPGTIRDSLYVLDGLLEQQTTLSPTEIMTDTAGYTDVVFGLFWLLGYQFSPRLADIGETRFWRIDPDADYGALNSLSQNRINTDTISHNWDDLLRVAGSLKSGTVSASEFMRTLRSSQRQSALSKALTELGRIAKTVYLLSYIDDEPYRRRILTQLNRQEGRHALARTIFYGHRGELRQRYREGQEDQLGALGLTVNAVILWNTIYMDRALQHIRATGQAVNPEDEARLSPLKHEHVNVLGRHQFRLPEAVKQGSFRPLRNIADIKVSLLPETLTGCGLPS